MIHKNLIVLSLVLLPGAMVNSYREKFPGSADALSQAQPGSPILYRVNFEDNDPFPSFLRKQTSTSHALQVVENPVFEGKKAARFELRDSDPENNNGTRTEILLPGPADKNSLERWYAFALYFPGEDFDIDSSDEVISQWHQGGKATPSLCIRTQDNRIRLRIKPNLNRKQWIELGTIEKNVWRYYVMHVKHSPGTDGVVEIWRDGVQVVNYKGANMYDISNGVFHTPNWKLGIYKSDWNGASVTKTNKRVLYFDDIKAGDEQASYTDMKAD